MKRLALVLLPVLIALIVPAAIIFTAH